jgi:hypothetical protein
MTQPVTACPPPRRYQLGETDDPRELVPGDPETERAYARMWQERSTADDSSAARLRGLPLTKWVGAADTHAAHNADRVRRHDIAADTARAAAHAITAHADALAWAQRRAAEAIALYNAADQPTSSGDDRAGDRRDRPLDPEARRDQARELLDHARAQLATIAEDARAATCDRRARAGRRAHGCRPARRHAL